MCHRRAASWGGATLLGGDLPKALRFQFTLQPQLLQGQLQASLGGVLGEKLSSSPIWVLVDYGIGRCGEMVTFSRCRYGADTWLCADVTGS